MPPLVILNIQLLTRRVCNICETDLNWRLWESIICTQKWLPVPVISSHGPLFSRHGQFNLKNALFCWKNDFSSIDYYITSIYHTKTSKIVHYDTCDLSSTFLHGVKLGLERSKGPDHAVQSATIEETPLQSATIEETTINKITYF